MIIKIRSNKPSRKLMVLMLLILSAAVIFSVLKMPKKSTQNIKEKTAQSQIKGVWISYIEFGEMIWGKTLDEYKSQVENCISNVKSLGLNTVILHVRSHCDAFYESKYFPWSYQICKQQGVGCGFDPLKEFLDIAHKNSISVHAWINPYRVTSGSSGLDSLCETNPALKLNENEQTVVKYETGIYLNPADEGVRTLIINGVRELVENYEIDGIHFDDYFYPTTDENFDSKLYQQYMNTDDNAIKLSLDAWRRNQVNLMITGVYTAVKSSGKDILFGISPQANIEKNFNTYYADVKLWSHGGYCDYICPQIYFGFEYPKEGFDFVSLADAWKSEVSEEVQLVLGLASYKSGKEDSTSREWIENTDILKRQCEYANKLSSGICFYSYSSLFSDDENCAAERNNLNLL